ncbi:toll/interleukin-1 receptor domain-containing protein [Cupriavidus pampae]|uniref:TIR domain-containing protein n=1 Tax=Cupriavidus pampae TaxID=659251 RepID=A0ABN7YZ77_9BURK|nr:toll/interleukin-1 receptor domain-containing protein [Cupriavidus pampae]CAG9179019.1 hypothetical protein LMG32289_04245 [Cupriavidus pampae]
MARIFISYTQQDRDFAFNLSEALTANGHDIVVDVDSLAPGDEWREKLGEGLKKSEALVVLLSPRSLNSPHVMAELGAARAYAGESGRMVVIPVLLDLTEIPSIVADVLAINATGQDLPYVVSQIERAVSAFVGRKAAKEEAVALFSRRIENSAPQYIDDALTRLASLERSNGRWSACWNILGFSALLAGIAFSIFGAAHSLPSQASLGWVDFAFSAIRTVLVITLLGAAAKYAFSLGKTYANESLRNADRRHAIEFGKFYLRVFGSEAGWSELKEVFQHWNIDRSSSFAALDASQIDPKVVELATQLLKDGPISKVFSGIAAKA